MAGHSLESKSILVTGGAGFIGSHLVERLIKEKPARIVVLDNLWLGTRENLAAAKKAFPKLKLDTRSSTSFAAVKDVVRRNDVDVVFDLATIPLPASLVKPRWAADGVMKMGTVIAELARLEEYATLVHCSSSEAYGSAQYVPMDEAHPLTVETPYAAAKAAADLIVRSYWETFGIDAAIVRPFNNYGPRQNDKAYAGIIPIVLDRIRRSEAPVIYGDGEQTRDYIFVTDTAEAIVRVYQEQATRHRAINIASGKEVTVNELVTHLCKIAGFTHPPRYEAPRPGDVRRHLADTTLAKKLLGFEPRVALADGLRQTVEWYARAGRAPKTTRARA